MHHQLFARLKGFSEEDLADAIASKLEGAAFDTYMRLPDADKRDADRVKVT